MNRLLLAAVLILFLFFTGCTDLNESPSERTEAPNEREEQLSHTEMNEGIVLAVEPQSIHLNEIPDFVRLTITNLSGVEYQGGYHYAIDFLDGDNWVLVVAPEVTDEELLIQPGETFVLEFVQLVPNSHNYVAGRYRVRFSSWYAEFTIFE